MKFIKIVSVALIIILLMLLGAYLFQDKKTSLVVSKTTKYELVKDWPKLPNGFFLGNPTGIGIDTNQHLFIFHRANRTWPLISDMPTSFIKEKTILMLDKETGSLLNSWGNDLFIMPHGLTIDHKNNVWVTDVGLHQIFKFSNSGKLLMKLGEAFVKGNDHSHFNKPTDIAIAKTALFMYVMVTEIAESSSFLQQESIFSNGVKKEIKLASLILLMV